MEERTRSVGVARTTLTLTIELDPETDPVAGTLKVGGGEERQFSGWMELSYAIAAAQQDGIPADVLAREHHVRAGP
jgi:hypothetical protein